MSEKCTLQYGIDSAECRLQAAKAQFPFALVLTSTVLCIQYATGSGVPLPYSPLDVVLSQGDHGRMDGWGNRGKLIDKPPQLLQNLAKFSQVLYIPHPNP